MRHETQTLGEFLRRIAIDYARFGYTRYAVRIIPEGKDLDAIDRKLIAIYGVTSCRTTRMRIKRQGKACVQYLRFQHSFVLLATPGEHAAFSKICSFEMKDSPLHFRGYSIGFSGSTVSVRVAKSVWSHVRREVRIVALKNRAEVERAITSLPFYKFPGVVAQINQLIADLNRVRKRAGLVLISPTLPHLPYHHRCLGKHHRQKSAQRPASRVGHE